MTINEAENCFCLLNGHVIFFFFFKLKRCFKEEKCRNKNNFKIQWSFKLTVFCNTAVEIAGLS